MRVEKGCYAFTVDEDEGTLMTLDEYMSNVEDTCIMDHDGFGFAVKDGMEDWDSFIHPSDGLDFVPLDATHIMWFNK